ncbi:peptidase S41, partial [Escherichia coli]|nr:peptidase S41 [Escherichia coli]
TRAALDFIQGKSCTAISAVTATAAAKNATETGAAAAHELLAPARPSVPQRDVPGMF